MSHINVSNVLWKSRFYYDDDTIDKIFKRISLAYAYDNDHADRIFKYLLDGWFIPATPIIANTGNNNGYPISCFLCEVQDNLQSITDFFTECAFYTSNGGGIGLNISNVRSFGESFRNKNISLGTIPYVKIIEQITSTISQGSVRRGSCAIYMHVSHPDIEKFMTVRKPTGGDNNFKAFSIHAGVIIDDCFLKAVQNNDKYQLVSPVTKMPLKYVNARELWINILLTRLETGEPYILFIDNANRARNDIMKKLGMKITTSNLCSEILLPTGYDYLGKERHGVCCLSSVNLEYFDHWKNNKQFIEDIMYFLDNVLSDFQLKASTNKNFEKAVYSSIMERSIGIGVMGFASYLQSKNLSFDSKQTKNVNIEIFSFLSSAVNSISKDMSLKFGPCKDALNAGYNERFLHKLAIAPTASIALLANTSQCVEPFVANAYIHKNNQGSFIVKNKHLQFLLNSIGYDNENVWTSIVDNLGSVSHLPFLNDKQKSIFKTSFEIDQSCIINLAIDRSDYICQGQSINLFFKPDVSKAFLHKIHSLASIKLKTLYYVRSLSIQRSKVSLNDTCDFCV